MFADFHSQGAGVGHGGQENVIGMVGWQTWHLCRSEKFHSICDKKVFFLEVDAHYLRLEWQTWIFCEDMGISCNS